MLFTKDLILDICCPVQLFKAGLEHLLELGYKLFWGDGRWVEQARGWSVFEPEEVFSYSPVGHPPSRAVPARRQLLAPADSW